MNLGNSIRHGAKWVFIGNTGSQVINFALGLILARLMMPSDFGMVATIMIFTGLAGFIAGGGMGQALVRAKEASKRDYDLLFTLQLLIGAAIFGFFYAIAPWFAKWYAEPLYADLLRVSALSFFIRPFFNVPSNILFRAMQFKAKTMVQFANLVAYNAVSLSMAFFGYGPWSLVVASLVSSVIGAALFAKAARWMPGLSLDLARARELARYGFLVSANNIVGYLRGQAATFVLSRAVGPAGVGIFDKARSVSSKPHGFITGSVYEVLFRALATEQDNLDKCRYLFFRSITLVLVYAMPFYVGMMWLAKPLVITLYGQRWAETAEPLALLCLAGPFMVVENLSGAVLAARSWLGRELLPQIIMVVVTSAAAILGLEYGLKGVAIGLTLAAAYMATHMFWLAKQAIKARWLDLLIAFRPALLLNLILATALLTAEHLLPGVVKSHPIPYVLAMTAAGGLVYALSFLYLPLGTLQTEQQRWIAKFRLPGNQLA